LNPGGLKAAGVFPFLPLPQNPWIEMVKK
jgi:hypothetical protein